jgi:hypothetical protein
MIENQDELRSALGTINKQKEQIRGLVSLPTANQNAPALDSAHIEDLQNQVIISCGFKQHINTKYSCL